MYLGAEPSSGSFAASNDGLFEVSLLEMVCDGFSVTALDVRLKLVQSFLAKDLGDQFGCALIPTNVSGGR